MAFASNHVRFFASAWSSRRVAAAMLGATVVVTSIAALYLGTSALADLAPLATFVAYPAAIAFLWLAHRGRKPSSGALMVDEAGVTWNARRIAARADLVGGFVIPASDGAPEVRLERRFPRRRLDFLVPDEATGRQILAALGLDAAQTIATIRLASLLRGTTLGGLGNVAVFVALCAAGFVAVGSSVVAPVLVTLAAAWVGLGLLPARARVGADGVLVEWLGQRRFHRFDDLASVRMFIGSGTAGVVLVGRDGAETKLPMMGLFSASMPRDDILLAVKRIEQAREVHHVAQGDRGVALPPRGGRPAIEWLRSLRALGSGANADHRTAPVQPDALFRIAEDPGSEPARRVAAAVALSSALGASVDGAGRERLRIVAATTADPDLRAVLELAADEAANDDALAAAVERAATGGSLRETAGSSD